MRKVCNLLTFSKQRSVKMSDFIRYRNPKLRLGTARCAILAIACAVLMNCSAHLRAQCAGEGGNSLGFDMAPETSQRVVEDAVKQIPTPMAPGPVKPTWDSLQENYKVPSWFRGAKFGIFMHFGIFSVPAHGNEWYEKFLYAGGDDSVLKVLGGNDMALGVNSGPNSTRAWHTEHFGPPDKFGYKDFIPMFKAEHFDADAWAALFKKAGARYVMPGAQHHENFAMWDSKVTPFNSMQMGPKRDIIGELAVAVRKQGMKLGVANHGIENFEFINPPLELAEKMKAEKVDLYDPKWADFYNYADRSNAAMKRFLVNWYERNVELIDKYQPDLIYFDNGVDQRHIDPLKLRDCRVLLQPSQELGQRGFVHHQEGGVCSLRNEYQDDRLDHRLRRRAAGRHSHRLVGGGPANRHEKLGIRRRAEGQFARDRDRVAGGYREQERDVAAQRLAQGGWNHSAGSAGYASRRRQMAGDEWRGDLRYARMDEVRGEGRRPHLLHREERCSLRDRDGQDRWN